MTRLLTDVQMIQRLHLSSHTRMASLRCTAIRPVALYCQRLSSRRLCSEFAKARGKIILHSNSSASGLWLKLCILESKEALVSEGRSLLRLVASSLEVGLGRERLEWSNRTLSKPRRRFLPNLSQSQNRPKQGSSQPWLLLIERTRL